MYRLTRFICLVALHYFFVSIQVSASPSKIDAHTLCNHYLTAPHELPRDSFLDIALRAQHRIGHRRDATPKFIHLTEELERETLRTPDSFPTALGQFFPEGIGAIAHNLHSADEPATVRFSQPSHNLYVRWQGEFKGRHIGTNLTVSPTALYHRLANPTGIKPKYLVDQSSKAAIFWVHGGGTPTANAATATDLMDSFHKSGVEVIATDMPLHGEGPTFPFTSHEESFEYILHLMDTLIDPNVPVFVAGHSMGGQFAMMMHRLSYQPKYQRIRGYISLAGVADPAPGKPWSDKIATEEQLEAIAQQRYERMAPADRVFLENIVRNGKNAPTAMYFVNLLRLGLDWTTPPREELEKLKPMLSIIGARDGLTYVGYEQQFADYHAALKDSTQFVVIGDRTNIHEKVEPVGHGLFAHYSPGTTSEFETYSLMKRFIDSQLGAEHSAFELDQKAEQDASSSTNWLKLWSHNLAFRQFADNFWVYRKKIHPDLLVEQEFFNSIRPILRQLETHANKLKTPFAIADRLQLAFDALKDDLHLPSELASFDHFMRVRQADLDAKEKLQALYSPINDPNSHLIETIVRKRKDKEAQRKDLSKELGDLTKTLAKAKAKREDVVKVLIPLLKSAQHPDFQNELADSEVILLELLQANKALGEAQFQFMLDLKQNGQLNSETIFDLPPHIHALSAAFEKTDARYRSSLQQVVALQKKLALDGLLTIPENPGAQELIQRLAHELWSDNPHSLNQELSVLTMRIGTVISQQRELDREIGDLLSQYAQLVPGTIIVERVKLVDILNSSDPHALIVNQELLNPALNAWITVWSSRPPSEKEDVHRSLPFD